MKKTVLALVVAGFLVGCGGGGANNPAPSADGGQSGNSQGEQDGSQAGSSQQGSGNGNYSWTPVTSNFTCIPEPTTINGMTLNRRYAADGAIKVECITQVGYTQPLYTLTGMDSIEITDYIRTERITGTSDQHGAFTSTEITNFKTGEKQIKGTTSSGYSIDCVERYPVLLPVTVSKDGLGISDINEFIDYEISDYQNPSSTTCPQSYYDDNDNNVEFAGTSTQTVDIVITDSSGNVHKASSELKSIK